MESIVRHLEETGYENFLGPGGAGDCYTFLLTYHFTSSSRFLIMTLGAGRKDMDTITGRIAHVFREKAGKETNAVLFYDFNQMKSRNHPTSQL